jgi:hypothetical protein
MKHRGALAAVGCLAVSLMFLAVPGPVGGQHGIALAASASALALLIAGLLRCARALVLTESTAAARAITAVRSSSRELVVPAQRDPDAAGKQHSRAPGFLPSAG